MPADRPDAAPTHGPYRTVDVIVIGTSDLLIVSVRKSSNLICQPILDGNSRQPREPKRGPDISRAFSS